MNQNQESREAAGPVVVVVIRSLSYTGTTWINTLLGCHRQAFALGPPDRIIAMSEEGWQDACRVHGRQCTFWPAFQASYDPSENFYLQLARAAGRRFIIINNPLADTKASRDLKHPDIVLKHVAVVRDGRAACRSFVRNTPGTDFHHAVTRWFQAAAERFAFDPQDPDVLCVRYEDVVGDQFAAIRKFGEHVGLRYPDNFHRFWEFDHHLTSGSASMTGMIRRFQLGKEFKGARHDFYEGEYARLREQPEKPVFDERWKEELGRRELFLFDYCCGVINEAWGYPRDRFSAAEFAEFTAEIDQGPGARPPRLVSADPPPLQSRSRLGRCVEALKLAVRAGRFFPARRVRQLAVVAFVAWVVSVLAAVLLTWLVLR